MAKIQANNSEGHKKIKVPTSMLCRVCKCSADLVRKHRSGKLSGEGMVTNRVQIAELLLEEGLNDLVKKVSKSLLPFTSQTSTDAVN